MLLDLTTIQKALQSLKEAIALYDQAENDQPAKKAFRDSIIQRFEYTYELSWKLIQRWLKENVSPEAAEPLSRKDLYREAAKAGLIKDPEEWFDYHEARNNSVHTYNEHNAEKVCKAAIRFIDAANYLTEKLLTSND